MLFNITFCQFQFRSPGEPNSRKREYGNTEYAAWTLEVLADCRRAGFVIQKRDDLVRRFNLLAGKM